MPKMTQEEVKRAVSEMIDAGFNEGEIDGFLRDQGALPQTFMERPLGEQGLIASKTAASFAGPAIGGMYGAQLAAGKNLLPFLGGAGRAATQFLGEGAGIAAGDMAARAATRRPQNLQETLETAGGGAALGSAFRGAVRAGGYFGNVPEAAIQGAAEPATVKGVPVPVPNLKSVTRAGPNTIAEVKGGISPEFDLATRASKAARMAKGTLTTARMEKELLIRKADALGVRIPVEPIKDALRDNLPMAEAENISDFRLLRNKINQAVAMLDDIGKEGGTTTPGKIDKLIRKVLRPKIYTATGKPSNNAFAQALADAEDSATDLLNKALPGDIASKNAEITRKLTDTENAVALFGDPDKAGVINRIKNAFNGGNELSARALQSLSEHDKSLVDDAFKLYGRRQFGGDIREAPGGSGGGYQKFIGHPLEIGTRVAAPFQRFVGGTAAGSVEAYKAFKKAIEESP